MEDVKKILLVTMKNLTIRIKYDFRDSHFNTLDIVSNINGVVCMISTNMQLLLSSSFLLRHIYSK